MSLPQSVLIIDDEEGVGHVLCRLLRNHFPNARIIWASNFAPPIDPVDVIVLDLFLKCPMEDTLESLRNRRRDLPPIVCITGKADAQQALVLCMEAGAQDFISKDRAIPDSAALAEKIHLAYLRHKHATKNHCS